MSASHTHEPIALSAAALTAFVLAARRRARRSKAALDTITGAAAVASAPTPHDQKLPLALRVRGSHNVH